METENTEKIYSSLNNVWPQNNSWYSHLHKMIIRYVENNLNRILHTNSKYLNAGSGGSTYNLPGICYHIDIAANLIKDLPNAYVASIEKIPFEDNFFDSIICVGSVINYCSALESISEFSRVLKKEEYLFLNLKEVKPLNYGLQKNMPNLQHCNIINIWGIYTLYGCTQKSIY